MVVGYVIRREQAVDVIVITARRQFNTSVGGVADLLLDVVVESVFVATFDGLLNGWIIPKRFHGWKTIAGKDVVWPDVLGRSYDILVFLAPT